MKLLPVSEYDIMQFVYFANLIFNLKSGADTNAYHNEPLIYFPVR